MGWLQNADLVWNLQGLNSRCSSLFPMRTRWHKPVTACTIPNWSLSRWHDGYQTWLETDPKLTGFSTCNLSDLKPHLVILFLISEKTKDCQTPQSHLTCLIVQTVSQFNKIKTNLLQQWSKLLPFRAFVSASPVHRTPSIMHIRHLTLFLGETNFHCGQNRWARRVKGLEGKRKGGKQPWWPELAIPCALFFHVQCGALLQHVFCICVHPQLCQCSCLHVKCSGPLWVDILSLHCVTQSCLCLLAQQIG